MTKRKIIVLGATGTVGRALLSLVATDANAFDVVGLTGFHNLDLLAELVDRHQPRYVAVADELGAERLRRSCAHQCDILVGPQGVAAVAAKQADWTLVAIVGFAALVPTLNAIAHSSVVAIANKEVIICAGQVLRQHAAQSQAQLLPVDSEHNALFQIYAGVDPNAVTHVTLTASGGPLRSWQLEALADVTPEIALAHPNWAMGPKISVDSATMVNKVCEVLEAAWWFSLKPQQITILIHPEQVIHALLTLRDGTVFAQMGVTDMRLPLVHALYYPQRATQPDLTLDIQTLRAGLSFDLPSHQRYPVLAMIPELFSGGHRLVCAFNAANELAVDAFLKRQLAFSQIANVIALSMQAFKNHPDHRVPSTSELEQIVAADTLARSVALDVITRMR